MTVGELREKLNAYDSALLVALADWQEEYKGPSLEAADKMQVRAIARDSNYDSHPDAERVSALVLGEEDG